MAQLRDSDRPLHGRFDWSHRLQPFDYFDARRMVPERSMREATVVYGIFGGTPKYLDALRRGEALAASGQGWAHAALPEEPGARYLYVSAVGFTDDFRELASEDDRIRLVELGNLYGEEDGE